MGRTWVRIGAAALLVVGIGAVATAEPGDPSAPSPSRGLLPNGRQLHPVGVLTAVGNFPTGGAATPDGRFYWTVSTGRGYADIRIVSLQHPGVVQVVPIPGSSGGIAMDPRRPVAYVSGIADSTHLDQQRPGLPGRQGDVVHVFRYDPRGGHAEETGVIPVPPPAGTPPPQAFPPGSTPPTSWPDRLAVSPDGGTLLVPLNLADAAAVVDAATGAVRYVPTGRYPYGAAILPGGRTGLVTNEVSGTVSIVDLATAAKVGDVRVGAERSHPEGIVVDPAAPRAYVAIANSDQVAVVDTRTFTLERTLSVERPAGIGTAPVDVAVTPDGRRLLVAESGADEIAVFRLPTRGQDPAETAAAAVLSHEAGGSARRADGGFTLIGRLPTADYPAAVAVTNPRCPGRTERCTTLVYLAAKGLGVGPNPNGPTPFGMTDDNTHSYQYLPNLVTGDVGALRFPTDGRIRELTPVASRQIVPTNLTAPPPGTPLRPGGPIRHVFFVVKENRTYDQVLGDVRRGDGDPALTLFGRDLTPNAHALVDRFPLLDHTFADSEASIDGHFWTSAAKVSDYVHKNWFQNYAGRGRPLDFGLYAVSFPANGFLFDQAERQGISYANYGEVLAGVAPLPDRDQDAAGTGEVLRKLAHSDVGPGLPPITAGSCYPNDGSIAVDAVTGAPTWDSTPPAGADPRSESRFDCFTQHFTAQVAAGAVPAFNYLVLPNDHTVGTTPGQRTPQALVADNDYGLGQVVDLISHSPVWASSAIFVVEDDSQDGADHVDAHRIPVEVISPYTRPGAVVHTRYDFLSIIRSMELILGLRPLGLFDRLAAPMYDVFTARPVNPAPFDALPPTVDRLATNGATAPDAALSRSLDFRTPDQIPQLTLDRILWHAVHGPASDPPPPGPNASRNDG
jgi:DNA-binding beta-propeller fold protein YncE